MTILLFDQFKAECVAPGPRHYMRNIATACCKAEAEIMIMLGGGVHEENCSVQAGFVVCVGAPPALLPPPAVIPGGAAGAAGPPPGFPAPQNPNGGPANAAGPGAPADRREFLMQSQKITFHHAATFCAFA